MVHLMTLWWKKGTELVSHVMLIPGCLVYISCRDPVKRRMSSYHWVKNRCCFTDSFHQCFFRDITGTDFKLKFFIKKCNIKKPQNLRSSESLLITVSVKILTGWKVRNSVTEADLASQDLSPSFFRSLKVAISTDIFLHCPLIWRYTN